MKRTLVVALLFWLAPAMAYAGHKVQAATADDINAFENELDDSNVGGGPAAAARGSAKGRDASAIGSSVSGEARKLRDNAGSGAGNFGQSIKAQRQQNAGSIDKRQNRDSSTLRDAARGASEGKGKGRGRGKSGSQ